VGTSTATRTSDEHTGLSCKFGWFPSHLLNAIIVRRELRIHGYTERNERVSTARENEIRESKFTLAVLLRFCNTHRAPRKLVIAILVRSSGLALIMCICMLRTIILIARQLSFIRTTAMVCALPPLLDGTESPGTFTQEFHGFCLESLRQVLALPFVFQCYQSESFIMSASGRVGERESRK